ncbi:MAG: hypothetical protein QXV46_03315 [Candidatus Bathyarchaeia archaeon]
MSLDSEIEDIHSIPTHIICYPKPSEEERAIRVRELHALGIKYILSKGPKVIDHFKILGKGCSSVIVLASTSSGLAVVKIRRTDAGKKNMYHEIDMLAYVNSFGIGPQLLGYTENMILMEYVDGCLLKDWLIKIYQNTPERVRHTLSSLMSQCYMMDRMLVDHGELTNASKHVIIRTNDISPVIIDFESASRTRMVKNLTSICQYLFMNKSNMKAMQDILGVISLESLRGALMDYKIRRSRECFLRIMRTCNIRMPERYRDALLFK